jgi:hypothetical protein
MSNSLNTNKNYRQRKSKNKKKNFQIPKIQWKSKIDPEICRKNSKMSKKIHSALSELL